MSLNTEQKVMIISESEEVIMAVKMLISTMEEAKIQNSIQIDYVFNNKKYSLIFAKTDSK